MTTKHTQGPWTAVLLQQQGTNRKVQFKGANGHGALVISHDGSPEGLANEAAALAAPELLTIAQEIFSDVHTGRAPLKDNATLVRLHAAIAKATGEQP